ncbi:hypothetical protein BY458DRAFT_528767 [Sporodiniella umbellata]|nr:hypothetical protein BY458DRAFT_528767 [Sporodiniella umbellata]
MDNEEEYDDYDERESEEELKSDEERYSDEHDPYPEDTDSENEIKPEVEEHEEITEENGEFVIKTTKQLLDYDYNPYDSEEEAEEEEFKIDIITQEILDASEPELTTKYLTTFEKAGVVGHRAKELERDYNKDEFVPLIKLTKDVINEFGEMDFIRIAQKELFERKLAYYICRKFKNGRYKAVYLNDLIF